MERGGGGGGGAMYVSTKKIKGCRPEWKKVGKVELEISRNELSRIS